MKQDNRLTRSQLEQLIELYFDARLDRDDERRLARVLAYTDIDSPAIAGARAAMGVEVAARRNRRRAMAAIPWRHITAAAASLAVLLSIALYTLQPGMAPDSAVPTVYVNGRPVTDPVDARRVAVAELQEINEFMREMTIAQLEAYSDTQQIINSNNQIK
ncbi:MAG: hypothetical protein Q4C34_04255 [Bacteroidales bacterium]|nr:hypothetical protein [Bacteroidales bacterium]